MNGEWDVLEHDEGVRDGDAGKEEVDKWAEMEKAANMREFLWESVQSINSISRNYSGILSQSVTRNFAKVTMQSGLQLEPTQIIRDCQDI